MAVIHTVRLLMESCSKDKRKEAGQTERNVRTLWKACFTAGQTFFNGTERVFSLFQKEKACRLIATFKGSRTGKAALLLPL